MAAFSFYATTDDRRAIVAQAAKPNDLQWFLSEPDLAPIPCLLEESTLNTALLRGNGQFYGLPGPRGSRPVMDRIHAGKASGHWYIDAIRSPPMLVLSLPPHYEEDGWRLGPGSLYYPASRSSGSDELKALQPVHAETVRRLKDAVGIRSRSVGAVRRWMSDGAFAAFNAGAKILVDGIWIGVSALAAR